MANFIFNEYEAFCETIGEAAVKMRLTNKEESRWTLQSAIAGSLRLQQGYEGGGSIAEGTTLNEGWVFYHQSHPGHTNGQAITPDRVFAAPPGSEFCLVCHPAHEWFTVFVPTCLLFPFLAERDDAFFRQPRLLKPPSRLIQSYAGLVNRFLAAAEARPQLLSSSIAVKTFQAELIQATQDLFLKNQQAMDRHSVRWFRQAKSAIELATHDPATILSVSDLSRISGVPERTLRTAFKRCYGLSPAELMRIARLNQARQLLLASCPDQTTVTKIAFELGFWDLGRFAGNYRRLYGELPSATLRKPADRSLYMSSVLSPNKTNNHLH